MPPMMSFDNISRNFTILKAVAILTVVAGHFYPQSVRWIPTSVVLLIFSFLSANSTTLRYQEQFETRSYWRANFFRLIPSLLAIYIVTVGVLYLVGHAKPLQPA
jgi:peptidoglycan/LPS O-acetylase OafA/YrhL